jgi:integrase
MDTADIIRKHTLDQRRRGLQESTIAIRRRMIRHLADHLGAKGLFGATAEDIERFLDTRRTSPGARAGYLSHLKVFYGWAVAAGHLDRDPTLAIPRPKRRKGLPRPINDGDLALALDMSGGQILLILTLAAFQGLRCIEISRLTREDIFEDRDPPMLLARGKGDKHRLVPIHPSTLRTLALSPIPRSGPIIRNSDGRPLPAWKVSHVGNDYLHGLGIDSTMHQLRHWFATGIYRATGGDLLLTQDLLGHANVETTRVYAAFDRAGAPEAVAALEVRGRDPTVGGATALRGAPGAGEVTPDIGSPTEGSSRHPAI